MKRCYILVVDKRTWEHSFLHNLWGFSERTTGLWNTSNVGDLAVFYVTSALSKVIGFGKVTLLVTR
jgi:hypothetical protein